MLSYLFNLTIIWAILLLLYQFLFRYSSRFKANRVYLFTAIIAGIVIPLLTLKQPVATIAIENAITLSRNYLQTAGSPGGATPQRPAHRAWSAGDIAWIIYIAGTGIALLMALRELAGILKNAIYGNYITVSGHKIFSSTKAHAPYSFMGWIFIYNPGDYTEAELDFLLKHENAHNKQYHWVDTILIQLCTVIFWFHPLAWRFRYLLKLNHEFEADQVAAGDNAYEYGHFLLEQTLLKGTPSVAHSFHFSPIKYRITMLTKTKPTRLARYVLVVPALLACTFLFARSAADNQRVRTGDKTTYKGNDFYWEKSTLDSVLISDAGSGEQKYLTMERSPGIYRMDNDSVYQKKISFDNYTQPGFRNETTGISAYLTGKFREKITDKLDSISSISIVNVVLDAEGKIKYYELSYRGRKFLDKAADSNPYFDAIIDEILVNAPAIETKSVAGKGVPTYLPDAGAIILNGISGKAVKVKF